MQSRWADTYLSQTDVGEWDILHYIAQYHALAPRKKLLCSWTKALSMIRDDESRPENERVKAAKLLACFQETDGPRVREWTPVVINNTITSSQDCHIGFNYPRGSDSDIPKRKRKSHPDEFKEKKERKKNGSGAQSRVRPLRESLRASYVTMDDAKKWKLPESGEYLEDILYERLRETTQEHSGHSWVVDLDDPDVKDWFAEPDWLHICEQMPQWLDRDPLLVNSLMRFESMKTPMDLFTILRAPYTQDEDNEDTDMDAIRQKYLGPDWANLVMRLLLPLYETPALFKSEYNLENWFNTHIWNGFLDQSMLTIKGVHLSRGESRSMSCSDRKSTKPVKGSRRQTGHRYDGVLRFNDIEIGAVEHAKIYEGQNSLKWTSDSLKLVKVLHDMFVRLQLHVHTEEALRSVSLVGLITAGLHCQPMRMIYAKGYICLVSRHELRQVPTTLEESGDLLSVLLDFWGIRTLVHNCTVTLEKCKADKRELFFRQLKSSTTLPPRAPTLPPSIETDTAVGDGD